MLVSKMLYYKLKLVYKDVRNKNQGGIYYDNQSQYERNECSQKHG
jgi:fibrillarin-like rRNA methylase